MDCRKLQEFHIRRVVAVLCVLLLLSLIALGVVTALRGGRARDTDIVPNNQIDSLARRVGAVRLSAVSLADGQLLAAPEDPDGASATVELYRGQPQDNLPFSVANMLPGDWHTRRFAVEVSHKNPVELYFNAVVTQQTRQLGQVLEIRVVHVESGEVVYEGSFDNMAATGYSIDLPQAAQNRTVATYEIRVHLPVSAGNEYQAAMLTCDLQWYVSDQGSLVPPQTGDEFLLFLWAGLAVASASGLLLISRRKEDDHE